MLLLIFSAWISSSEQYGRQIKGICGEVAVFRARSGRDKLLLGHERKDTFKISRDSKRTQYLYHLLPDPRNSPILLENE